MPEIPLIAMQGVTKTYAGITALDDVGFSIGVGEAVCLAGENGSGKGHRGSGGFGSPEPIANQLATM